MRIREVSTVGLKGATPEGSWSEELKPDDVVHTLVTVHTDEGPVGYGSVFTSEALVRAALEVLEPLYTGENALEPERVSEKLHQNTFWQGRGGAITHAISGVDIALWDILGKVTGQPVGRLLGGRYRERIMPYASLLMQEPGPLSERLVSLREQGFQAFKVGWGPFGRVSDRLDEAIVKAAREAVGDEAILAVDPGGSDAFWPRGYKWALRTSRMLAEYGIAWFEEPLVPDALDDFVAGAALQLRRYGASAYRAGLHLAWVRRQHPPGGGHLALWDAAEVGRSPVGRCARADLLRPSVCIDDRRAEHPAYSAGGSSAGSDKRGVAGLQRPTATHHLGGWGRGSTEGAITLA